MFRFSKTDQESRRAKLLQELAYIDLYTRRIAGQALVGDYRSKLRGQGLDFVEHKKYTLGEDYRQIDWNVLARSRQPYVKVHHAEKEIAVLLVADLSGSMEQGNRRLTKKEVLIEAAATIAFSAANSNMAVGLVGGTTHADIYLRPRKRARQAWRILDVLLGFSSPERRTNLEELVRFAAAKLKRPSMVFILSDFIGAEQFLQQSRLAHIAHHHDIVPVFIEDHLESTWPVLGGYMRLRDLETSHHDLLSLTTENCRELQRQMAERRSFIRRSFLRLGIIPAVLTTESSPRTVLREYFLRRKRHHR
jgi:uncharacterized protein (DUF58 family)